jgi:hypothetical protein
MRDKRLYGIETVDSKIPITESQDRAIDRLVLELRLSYGLKVSRSDILRLGVSIILAYPLKDLAAYLERV